jgi:hypothetical protein
LQGGYSSVAELGNDLDHGREGQEQGFGICLSGKSLSTVPLALCGETDRGHFSLQSTTFTCESRAWLGISFPALNSMAFFEDRVYYIFYRTLFARLRSPDQYAFIQLLSSIWIISFYPLSMTRLFHKALQWFLGYEKTLEEHRDVMGQCELTHQVCWYSVDN